MFRIGYKVTNRRKESGYVTHPNLQLRYELNKWTKPKVGLICIFEHLHNAQRYAQMSVTPMYVYKCQYVKTNVQPNQLIQYWKVGNYLWAEYHTRLNLEEEAVKTFWKDVMQDTYTSTHLSMHCPEGTIFTPAVRLLKLIDSYDGFLVPVMRV